MSSFERKLKRESLKQEIGNNRIKEYYHSKYDSLEKRLIRGIKNARQGNIGTMGK